MLVLLLPLLLLPRPMPPASVPPPDSPCWPEFVAAPPLGDLDRFPGPADVQAARDFNHRHRAWLARELAYELGPYRRSVLANWQREAADLYDTWDLLRDAQFEGVYAPWHRRVFLKRLRDRIGDEAYSRGEMPPAVPVWRFREMRP